MLIVIECDTNYELYVDLYLIVEKSTFDMTVLLAFRLIRLRPYQGNYRGDQILMSDKCGNY